MNRRRYFLRWLVSGIALGYSMPAALLAGTKKRHPPDPLDASPIPEETPAQEPSAEKKEHALLRVWKSSDALDLEVRLQLLPYGKPAQEAVSPLKIEVGNYHFSDYAEVPSGPVTAEISAADRPTVYLPLNLMPGGQSTVIVRVKGLTLSAEWISDMSEDTDNPCEFAVYNLLPVSGDIRIDLGSLLSAHLSSARSNVRLHGIKRAVYAVTAEGTDDKGKTFHWNTDVDFRRCRKATLLIYPDAYGRIRPRVNET